MIKNINFAFFSQLAYLNWNNLNNINFKTIESCKDKYNLDDVEDDGFLLLLL